MGEQTLTLLAVGDLILGPDAGPLFTHVNPVLQTGDVVVGQLEVPYTTRDEGAMALGRDPRNLRPLQAAGFHLLTLAGNHLCDAGPAGIADTLAWLDAHGIAHVGAGLNLDAARRAGIIERQGTRFGFLAYNCVGPPETWAARDKPGCAYVQILTHYEEPYATPGGPPIIHTWAHPDSVQAMVADIQRLRSQCHVLVVTLHKGLGHTPVRLAAYERQVAHAAIDAGADLILAHHAHILRGVEWYRGKAIFHGLCNFVTWVPSLAPRSGQDPESWARRRRELFGFEPDPAYPTYPFHPEARYTMIAKCLVEGLRITAVRYIPCLINQQGQPEVLPRDVRGQQVFDYVERITRGADLNARFTWVGDEVTVLSGAD